MEELKFLKSIDHPNVVKFFECYHSNNEIHLVMEYCAYGDLRQKLTKEKRFSESLTKNIAYQMMYAINSLHK